MAANSVDYAVQENNVPKSKRDQMLKWNGWGYCDSYFFVNENKDVSFSGDRYDVSGKIMPHFRPWFESNLGVDLSYKTPSKSEREQIKAPSPTINNNFVDFLKQNDLSFSNDARYRINRAHGHTAHDIMTLRNSQFRRLPDLVVWPRCHDDVLRVVSTANDMDIVIIPIGGGTSVSSALDCPLEERRSIVSLDLSSMNRLIWIDSRNQLCRAEAGILGIDLEEKLNEKGFTTGHEPDSIEFSSLGGWVATRASGMKKNKYGNIEDLLVHVKIVTSKGVMQKSCQVPRMSSGPDIHHFILGSEGTLGVITEVTLKICHLPPCKRYGSIIFPSFEPGVNFFREVARQKVAPASLRLVDNEQFIMGQALKVQCATYWKMFSDKLKKLYITRWKGFRPDDMCAATLLLEGSQKEVEAQEKHLYEIGQQFGGLAAGEENGRYGYRLTFAIAYLRDLGFDYSIMGESFETSVPWDKVVDLCRNVKQLLKSEAKKCGIEFPVLATARVTQLYDSGACVYFYFGFNYRGLSNPMHIYESIETAARDEILACGGSISHHHGVGKLRKKWLPATVGDVGLSAMKAVKNALDPKNVFASGNLFTVTKL